MEASGPVFSLLNTIASACPDDGKWHMIGMYVKRDGEGVLIDDISRLEPAE